MNEYCSPRGVKFNILVRGMRSWKVLRSYKSALLFYTICSILSLKLFVVLYSETIL